MKRMKWVISIALVLILFTACSSAVDLTGKDAAQTILTVTENPEPYLGKEFVFSGYYTYEDFTARYHYVLLTQYAKENPGFEIRWDGPYPERGTHVKVRGILRSITEFGQNYIYLDVSELTEISATE